jgi:hypothetical protein
MVDSLSKPQFQRQLATSFKTTIKGKELSLNLLDITTDCFETAHHLKLVGTNDIRMHLFLDGKAGVLYI